MDFFKAFMLIYTAFLHKCCAFSQDLPDTLKVNYGVAFVKEPRQSSRPLLQRTWCFMHQPLRFQINRDWPYPLSTPTYQLSIHNSIFSVLPLSQYCCPVVCVYKVPAVLRSSTCMSSGTALHAPHGTTRANSGHGPQTSGSRQIQILF